jgi:BirA family biotin operon repressor/biotin-[acetyl-CoA-carboxylase] ligase
VHLFSVLGSTNDFARALADAGAPAVTLVLAERQTAGRGRAARAWESPAGVGLWFSLVLRDVPAGAVAPLPLVVALAVARALDPWVETPVGVKWPNVIFLEGRKMGGILCEASWEGGAVSHLTVGVGLNLLQGPGDFPVHLRPLATSLRIETARPVSRFQVASAVIDELRAILLDQPPSPSLLSTTEFTARDVLRNRKIRILAADTGAPLVSGYARGIASDGTLRVESADSTVAVHTGTVRLDR